MDLDKYNLLKKKADKFKAEAERAAGALDQLMGELKKEFGCNTVEDAEKLLKKLVKEEKKAKVAYDEELERFEEKWGNRLEEENYD